MYIKCIKKNCEHEKICFRRYPVLDKHYLNTSEQEDLGYWLHCIKSNVRDINLNHEWMIFEGESAKQRCISIMKEVKNVR